jgi:hypothetical protein
VVSCCTTLVKNAGLRTVKNEEESAFGKSGEKSYPKIFQKCRYEYCPSYCNNMTTDQIHPCTFVEMIKFYQIFSDSVSGTLLLNVFRFKDVSYVIFSCQLQKIISRKNTANLTAFLSHQELIGILEF